MCLGAGNDALVGNDGDDILIGGPGQDTYQGNDGDDWIWSDEADLVFIDGGIAIRAGAGTDYCRTVDPDHTRDCELSEDQ